MTRTDVWSLIKPDLSKLKPEDLTRPMVEPPRASDA